MRYIALSCFLFLLHISAFGQSYEECVELFQQNKREKALSELAGVIKNSPQNADAYLLKTLIEIENSHYSEGFRAFEQFYRLSDKPYAYLYALANSGIFGLADVNTRKDIKDFFRKVMDDDKAPAEVRAYAIDRVANYYELSNDWEASKKTFLGLEDVKNWSTVGVFENISESGFNKDFDVVAHPGPEYEFNNKRGAKVKWFVIPDVRNDRWWDFEYNYDISGSIIYAQTFIKSEEDREVLLRVGVSGSMKVWVNDLLAGNEKEERNTDLDVYIYKVKLQKGYNRVLLQVGASELGRSNYMVRLSTLDGQIIPGVVSEAVYQPYTKATPYIVQQLPFYPEKYFEDKLQEGKDDFITRLLLLDVYNHNDKKYKSRTLAAGLKKKYPNSTVVSVKLIEALGRDDNQVDLNKEIEFIKQNDSESYIGLLYRYNENYDKEEWKTCLRIVNRGVELYGGNEDFEAKTLDIYAKMNDLEKVYSGIKTAYKKYPANATFLSMQYLYEKNITKNIKAANELLGQYLKKYYNENLFEEVTVNYFNKGDKEQAIKRMKQLLEYKPYAVARYGRLASVYFGKQDYAKALEYQQMAIDHAPYIGQFYQGKGVIYETMGEKDRAIEMYNKAIYYTPSDYESRHKLRHLDGKKALGDYFASEDADFIYNKALNDNAYTDENAVYLLSDERQIIYPEGGASEQSCEVLMQVFNQTAIDRMKEISVPYNRNNQKLIIQKAEVLKTDGSKVAAEVQDNYIVFTALEKKDAIHFVYRIEESSTGTLSDHFWHDYTFNSFYPVQHARFSLIVPKDKKFSYKVYNADIEPTVSDIDDYKLYVWEKKNSPAIEDELAMPTYNDIAERVIVTSVPDWNFIAKWYSDVSTIKSKSDFEIKEKVKEVFAGGMPASGLEKAKAIYEYIERNFHYSNVPFLQSAFIPQTASHTVNAKMGDCKDFSTLFVAMAREVGLNANLVLVDTRDNGYNDLLLPVVGFNHCIAQLNIDNKKYYVELTNNYLPFGSLSRTLLNANALEIPYENNGHGEARLVRINTNDRPANTIVRVSEMSFDGEAANIKRTVYKTGSQAAAIRYAYKDMDSDARNKDMTAGMVNEFGKDVQLDTMYFSHLDDLNDTVALSYGFTVKKFTNKIMDMQVFKLPWTDNYIIQDFVTLSERKYPLELWFYSSVPRQSEEITVTFPPGKKLGEIPKDVSVSCPEMTYNITYKVTPGKLTARREIVFNKDIITPDAYAGFKEFVTKSNEANAYQLVLK